MTSRWPPKSRTSSFTALTHPALSFRQAVIRLRAALEVPRSTHLLGEASCPTWETVYWAAARRVSTTYELHLILSAHRCGEMPSGLSSCRHQGAWSATIFFKKKKHTMERPWGIPPSLVQATPNPVPSLHRNQNSP